MAHKNLYKAIIDKLRTDNSGADSLVTLTSYSVSNYSIARDAPIVKERTPFLGVKITLSVPLMGDGATTRLQTAEVELVAHARSELTSLKIADRLEYLVHEVQTTDLQYYDFSDSNVSNRQTMFKSREAPYFDDKTDVWSVQVTLDVIWINQSCS
jgi:hypothetical protein